MRDTMIVYRSFYEAIKSLPKENQIDVWTTVFSYTFDEIPPQLDGISNTVFTLIKPQLDANTKRYENGKKAKQKQTGSKGKANNKRTGSKTGANKNKNVSTEVDIQYVELIDFINLTLGRQYKGTDKDRSHFNARLAEGYTLEILKKVVVNASKNENHIKNGFQYLTPEFLTRADKIEMYKHALTAAPDCPPQADPQDQLDFIHQRGKYAPKTEAA